MKLVQAYFSSRKYLESSLNSCKPILVRSYRIILKMSKFPTCNTWGTFKSPVPRVTHGKRISHLSLTCPMCNTWGTYKSDLNSQ